MAPEGISNQLAGAAPTSWTAFQMAGLRKLFLQCGRNPGGPDQEEALTGHACSFHPQAPKFKKPVELVLFGPTNDKDHESPNSHWREFCS